MGSKILVLHELIKHEHQNRLAVCERDYSYFHPSEFYQCVRKLAYKYYGVAVNCDIKPDLQRVFDNGDYMHLRYNTYFENLGILYGVWKCKNPLCGMEYGKNEQYGVIKPTENCSCGCKEYRYVEKEVENKERMIRGHIDGILKVSGDFHVIDYKSMHTNLFSKLQQPLDKHIIQIQIYLWLLGLTSGFLLYENKDSQKIKIYEVDYNKDLITKIENRLKLLKDIVLNKKLPKRPFDKDSSKCKTCEYCTICWKIDVAENVEKN